MDGLFSMPGAGICGPTAGCWGACIPRSVISAGWCRGCWSCRQSARKAGAVSGDLAAARQRFMEIVRPVFTMLPEGAVMGDVAAALPPDVRAELYELA
jgi:hypothetical protein